jgi:hypothetical protein
MANHPLIATAIRKPRNAPIMPAGAKYDVPTGCWLLNDAPLVTTEAGQAPVTKKNDLETGEDQKGE